MADRFGDLKTEGGLKSLDGFLGDKSFVGGGVAATEEDMSLYRTIVAMPDRHKLPHLARWYLTISGLRRRFPDRVWSGSAGAAPKAPRGRAAGKERKELGVDCPIVPVPDQERTKLSSTPPPLGVGARCFPGAEKRGKYYITTAINYANGWPHMGHGYEGLTADVWARYERLAGKEVYYMTGSDEHGQKIEQAATADNKTPQQAVDMYAEGFQALNQRLLLSNDKYIRTSSAEHKKGAQAIWQKCKAKGDIFLDKYEGWYMVREERYVPEAEAAEMDYKDPGNGVPLKKMSEPSFFFRLSKYAAPVLKYIEDNPDFIKPVQYRSEILERLRSIEMRDLSISRGAFTWGVETGEPPVEGQNHVMYVWFEALTNYLNGVHGLEPKNPLSRFWPADVHVIGKDIVWFHSVIWPAVLMSCELPIPKHILVHGFIAGPDGRKMSKSYDNVVIPADELGKMSVDTFRWYLSKEANYGDDIKWSNESIVHMHNSDLCDKLGNLVNRAVNLSGGQVGEADISLVPLPFDLKELKKQVQAAFDDFRLGDAAELTSQACSATNKWIADLEPWKMKGDELAPKKVACIRMLLEAVYVLAHFYAPFIPQAATAIFSKLSCEARPIPELSDNFSNLVTGLDVITGSILFEQLVLPEASVAADKPAAEPKKKEAKGKGKGGEAKDKKEGKDKKDAKGAQPVANKGDDPDQPLFSKLDVRVGQIVEAWLHPDADSLFVEKVDVGDPEGPRQIVSGLRKHYTLEEFQGRKLLAVCNMKPAKMRNVESSGMVLCAKKDGKVELLDVPDGCKVGDRVLPKGMDSKWSPVDPSSVKKKGIWEEIAKDLKTNGKRAACFGGVALEAKGGQGILAPSLADSEIS